MGLIREHREGRSKTDADMSSPQGPDRIGAFLSNAVLGAVFVVLLSVLALLPVQAGWITSGPLPGWFDWILFSAFGLTGLATLGFAVSSVRTINRTRASDESFEAELQNTLQTLEAGDPDHWIYTAIKDDGDLVSEP